MLGAQNDGGNVTTTIGAESITFRNHSCVNWIRYFHRGTRDSDDQICWQSSTDSMRRRNPEPLIAPV